MSDISKPSATNYLSDVARGKPAGLLPGLPVKAARCLGLAVLALALVLVGCDGGGSNGGGSNGGGSDLTAPSVPGALSANPGDGEVSLSWDATSGADTYNVYRSTSSGVDTSGSPLESGISSTSYTDTGAQNDTEYFYAVSAVASQDGQTAQSEASPEVSALPFATPSGLGGTSGDSEVSLNWDGAAGADTYNVYRDTTSGAGVSGSPLVEDVSQTSYTDTSAQNGTTYYYVVTSVNPDDAESGPSGEIEKTPFSDPPSRP